MSKCKAIRGYTKLPNSVLMDTRLSGDARWLYVVLRSYTRPGKGECWPGQERLAKVAGWSTKTGQWDRWRVQRALDELEDVLLIRRERRGGGRTNCYTLLPVPEELLITDDSEVTAPTVMRKRRGRTQRKSASQQCASDAHRSAADPQHEIGGIVRNSAQHEIADQDGNLPQFSAPSCAQRSTSSLKGVGSSSSDGFSKKDFSEKDNARARELKKSDCRRCGATGQWPYGYCDECRKAMVRKAGGGYGL